MGFVKTEQKGHVAILTIDRPEALNALTADVLRDLGGGHGRGGGQ